VYPGHIVSNTSTDAPPTGEFVPADAENPQHKIPYSELTKPDPILFYAEVPLYEDELHDNGSSHVTVRIVSLRSKHRPKVLNTDEART
jgi:type 2A phosphatase activator TIP41